MSPSPLFAHAAGAWRQHCCTKAACWLQPSRSEEERKKNVRAQAACARMLGQLDGIRDQDERVTKLRAELTIMSTQLKEGELKIGAAARRLRQVAVY